jgi:hypothetical protein
VAIKICKICGEVKDESVFGSRNTVCKECLGKRSRACVTKNIDKIYAYLSTKECVLCGEKNPLVLEFHHNDPNNKIKEVIKVKTNKI